MMKLLHVLAIIILTLFVVNIGCEWATKDMCTFGIPRPIHKGIDQ